MSEQVVRIVLVVFAVGVLVGSVPVVAAQSETGVGGGIVVSEGETVTSLEGVAGSVLVEDGATVTGDVSAVSGDVRIEGTVEGDVSGAAGSVQITGDVGGDVSGGAGTVIIAEGATVGGSLSAGAGTVGIDGTVEADVTAGAETITLGEAATVGGDLRYGGTLEGNTDAVAGEITHDPAIGPSTLETIQPFTEWVFALYALLLNLLLGAALLVFFPRFSNGVATRVADDPVRTGLVGVAVVVGMPLLLVVFAITVIGIPVTIAGAFLFALLAWIGLVYGRFAVAAWVLSLIRVDNRWLALIAGMVGGALFVQVPYLGSLGNLLIWLLGLGALAVGLYSRRWQSGTGPRREHPTE